MSILDVITGQRKDPLHYGEVFFVWQHLMQAKSCIVKYSLLRNHVHDSGLGEFINKMIVDIIKPEVSTLEDILKLNGISPPPSPPDKPDANTSNIPPGARFSDQEIATCIWHDISMALVSCSQAIGISLREDIGRFFAFHHGQLVMQGNSLMKLMKDKGWIITPPMHDQIP